MDANQSRREFKFILPAGDDLKLRAAIAEHLPVDQGAIEGYSVYSEYFDTDDHETYWQKQLGHPNRRRVRTRIYGEEGDERAPTAFLEVKHKNEGLSVKRRLLVDYTELITADGRHLPLPPNEERCRVGRELGDLLESDERQAVVKIRYHRHAFDEGEDGRLRVTFDSRLRCSFPALDGEAKELPLLEPGEAVMEVKTLGNVPYWFRQTISKFKLVPRGFSKYTTALSRYHYQTS